MEMFSVVRLSILMLLIRPVISQPREVQPAAKPGKDCVCEKSEATCYCTLVVEHKLTMILEEEKQLIKPESGYLKFATGKDKGKNLNATQIPRVITADGEGSRLVIAVNGTFPGPRIEAFENQELQITIINTLHTDSVTVHFHGLYQKGTPHMDGLAFISQCPILPGQTFVHRF